MAADGGTPAFDLIGERYEQAYPDRVDQRQVTNWLIERLAPGGRVLDLGCGTGWPTAEQLATGGLDVVGVDESARMLEIARRRVPAARFEHRDMRELADLGEFDGAVSFFALRMLPRAEIRALLAEVRRRLRAPGLLVLAMVAGDFDDAPTPFLGVELRTTAYPPQDLAAEVGAAGFEVAEIRELDTTTADSQIEPHLYLLARAC